MAVTPTDLETYFLQLINEARQAVGSKPLTFDGELLNASDAHTAWMDQTDTFSHTGADGSTPAQRMTAAGYGWVGAGENIAYVSGTLSEATVRQLFNNLMNSPGHRANIERGTFEEVGIGLKQGTINGYNVVFVTQNFATPNAQERAEADNVGTITPVIAPVMADTQGTALSGTAYADTLTGGAGADTVSGYEGNDTLYGQDGTDSLVGGSGADVLWGHSGNDTLVGGSSGDALVGGRGSDYLVGGTGYDRFYFNYDGMIAGDFDQVADFQDGIDRIYLSLSLRGAVAVSDTDRGAFLHDASGSTGVFFTGVTAAQVQDQIFFV